MDNPYEVLGVAKTATVDEIKKAYKKAAMKFHPDRQHGKTDAEKKTAEEKFKACSAAAEILLDEDKRRNYDEFGSVEGGNSFNMNDFMRAHTSMFGDLFGGNPFGAFGFSSAPRRPAFDEPEDGADVRLNVPLTFEDVAYGTTKEFDVTLDEECSECHGKGIKKNSSIKKCEHCDGRGTITSVTQHGFMTQMSTRPCPACNGEGYAYDRCEHCGGKRRLPKTKHITINIPAGIDAGQMLRVVGKGYVGLNGGAPGNLYLRVSSVSRSEIFEKDGLDLKVKKLISPITASLGGTIEVPSLKRMISVDIPAGTKSGSVIVKKKYGIYAKDRTGDLKIQIEIVPLSNLTPEQIELLKTLEKTITDSNVPELTKRAQVEKAFVDARDCDSK